MSQVILREYKSGAEKAFRQFNAKRTYVVSIIISEAGSVFRGCASKMAA